MAKRSKGKKKMKLARRIVTTRDEFGLGGFGAVARHGSSGPPGQRVFRVAVEVSRDIGASTARQYAANACVARKRWPAVPRRTKGHYDTRCGYGNGRTPTAASKKALRSLASKLK